MNLKSHLNLKSLIFKKLIFGGFLVGSFNIFLLSCSHSPLSLQTQSEDKKIENNISDISEDHWIETNEFYSEDRTPSSEANKPGGLILNGPLKAAGEVGSFTLPSERRVLSQPMDPKPLTKAGMNENEIAITIDDGPSPENNAFVLETLRRHGVKAMFFVVGRRAITNPELIKNILREGHILASHTWTHPQMSKKAIDQKSSERRCPLDITNPKKIDKARVKSLSANEEIDCTEQILTRVVNELNEEDQKNGGTGSYRLQPFFRFPYGDGAKRESLQKLLSEHNLANFVWSMSAKDSETQDPNVALNTAVGMFEKYKSGLFLMHETHIAGVKALPYILSELHKRKYKTIYFEAENK